MQPYHSVHVGGVRGQLAQADRGHYDESRVLASRRLVLLRNSSFYNDPGQGPNPEFPLPKILSSS